MTYTILTYLMIFWTMQVVAQVFFKWGSIVPANWIWGFLGGNLFGFSSIWLLMLCYKAMNPNVILGISSGGAFLLSQIALAIIFKSKLDVLQWAGIGVIIVGILMLSIGSIGKSPKMQDLNKQIKQVSTNNYS